MASQQQQSAYHPPLRLGDVVERTLPNGQVLKILIGDINSDGHVDQDDLEVLQMLTGDNYLSEFLMDRLSVEELAACDINGDGTINHVDLVILCNQILAQMEMVSMTDELTGLYNRRGLKEKAYLRLRSAKKFGTPIACLAVDIDFFKTINDTYGHDMGDRVLCQVAETLHTAIRGQDIAARYGGEEFVILLDHTDAAGARALAEKLRQKVAETPVDAIHNGLKVRIEVTISVGISEFDGEQNLHGLIKNADSALYEAKQSGRNRVCLFKTA